MRRKSGQSVSKQDGYEGDWYDVEAADVWGCGVILFFLLTACDPFPSGKPALTDSRFLYLKNRFVCYSNRYFFYCDYCY